ncbi:hypothetical protein ABZ930_00705 [Streptomyces sp. NPDC046716]|uniref:hypothetical protein n=1 Tax=Streptomyces sp. NPDC046716 TaxID=3157093 RepID=UPI0033DE2AB1
MSSRSAATLRSRYAEQAASDLTDNRRRQQELADQLAVLKQQEALLVDILNLAERYEGFADASRLPEQVQDELGAQDAPSAKKAAAVTRTPAATKTPARKAPAAKKATASTKAKSDAKGKGDAKGKSRQPLLGDLLVDLLAGHDTPQPASDLREELLAKYPDRNPTPQVVRNTLESLVAKSRIRRHKKQRSVMYTLVKSAS